MSTTKRLSAKTANGVRIIGFDRARGKDYSCRTIAMRLDDGTLQVISVTYIKPPRRLTQTKERRDE